MEWFQGELSEAIASVKSSKKVLLVFVFGKDEDPSKEFLNALEACADAAKDYLCLKLEASSLGAAQLNAFYPVMVVPLIYIINHDGSALESICGHTTPEEIRAKLSSIESLVKGDIPSPEPSTSAEVVKPESALPVSSEAVKSSPSDGAAAADSPDGAAAADSPDGAASAADVEARHAAAQEQLVEIRRRKEREEKEKEKEKEQERREVGQRMTELKRFQREQELKELREEIAKKRKEERETRDRIRRQIEEDRRERMARNAPSSTPASATAAAAAAAAPSVGGNSSGNGNGASDGDTRLQFRLPDGSNVVHIFQASAPLSEAFDFITAELNGRLGTFRISSLYPRRLFGPDDMAVSLLDLALTPSAALVVMPNSRAGDGSSRGGGGVLSPGGGGGSLVELAMTPLLLVWGLLCTIFAALMALVSRPAPAPAPAATAATAAAARSNETRNAQRERRLGGINRLSDLPRDDDDINSWNGNSTQQK